MFESVGRRRIEAQRWSHGKASPGSTAACARSRRRNQIRGTARRVATVRPRRRPAAGPACLVDNNFESAARRLDIGPNGDAGAAMSSDSRAVTQDSRVVTQDSRRSDLA